MRTRISSVAAAIILAASALAGTAGTALMATPVTQQFCDGDNGQLSASYVYDTSLNPPPITDIIVVNNDTRSVPLTARASDPTTGAVVWSGTMQAKTGTKDFNIAGLGIHMVQATAKDGSHFWGAPYNMGCAVG